MRKLTSIIFVFFLSLIGFGQDDLINQLDENGNNSGLWKYTQIDTVNFQFITINAPTIDSDSIRIDTTNVLEGNYTEGLKEGVWVSNIARKCKTEVTFENDTLNGPIRIFYPEGQLHMVGEIHKGFDLVHFSTYSKKNQFCGWRDFPLEEILKDFTNLERAE